MLAQHGHPGGGHPEEGILEKQAGSRETDQSGLPLRRALAKARLRLIPLLALCYLVAFMDRANISFAAETMNRDLGFTPRQ